MGSNARPNPMANKFNRSPSTQQLQPLVPTSAAASVASVAEDHIDPAVTDRSDFSAPTYQPGAIYSLRLQLPGTAIQPYADRAAAQHLEAEDVMQRQLVRCSAHDDMKPLYLDDTDRLELERYLDTSFSSPRQLLDRVRRLVESVGTAGIPSLRFTPQQIERVASRCVKGETFADKLQEYCNFGINSNTGLD